jgi:hypothetical protein
MLVGSVMSAVIKRANRSSEVLTGWLVEVEQDWQEVTFAQFLPQGDAWVVPAASWVSASARPRPERARAFSLPTSASGSAQHTAEDGATIFQQACRMGLEGVVSKRLSVPYRPPPPQQLWHRCVPREPFNRGTLSGQLIFMLVGAVGGSNVELSHS